MRRHILSVLGLVLAGVIAILIWVRPAQPIRGSVRFLAYTQSITGQRFATFVVSNASPFPVRRWGFYDYQLRLRSGPADTFVFGPNVSLKPGESEVVNIPVLRTQGVWSATFAFSREGLRLRGYDWANTRPELPESLRGTPIVLLSSDWITP